MRNLQLCIASFLGLLFEFLEGGGEEVKIICFSK